VNKWRHSLASVPAVCGGSHCVLVVKEELIERGPAGAAVAWLLPRKWEEKKEAVGAALTKDRKRRKNRGAFKLWRPWK